MDWMEGSDAAIVQQVRSGEPDAFGVLVERHSRSLFRLAYRPSGLPRPALRGSGQGGHWAELFWETFWKLRRAPGGVELPSVVEGLTDQPID